ncbi:hypothetical protein GCM10023221_02400 [Luteimicrobium xylanilyticum]|uniref:Acid phosphatase n=1 Tax=Luteimicrobium xylanilyticum TaxID=1133546 RepID=A0A5P9Q7Q2_9MICO|nr:Acid phosphatase [Luteimicrobium xylanilyticum]
MTPPDVETEMPLMKHRSPTTRYPLAGRRLRRTGAVTTALGLGLAAALVGTPAQAATPAVSAPSAASETATAGGYWSASYEAGTPQPAGFPGSGTSTDVRGDRLVPASAITTVASTHANADSSSEHVQSLADRDPSTKWYARDSGAPSDASPVSAVYTLTTATRVTSYAITAGADSAKFPERDPKSWTVLGTDDADVAADPGSSAWHTVDARTNQTFASNGLTRFYDVAQPASYRYYQLRVTANAGGSAKNANTQIADWTLRSQDASGTAPLGVSVEDAGSVPGGDGSRAVRWSADVLADGHASSTVVLQSGLDVPVGSTTDLTYLVRPTDAASAHTTVDVVYTDADGGSPHRFTAPATTTPAPGRWDEVTVSLAQLAGKHVTELLLSYADDDAHAGPVEGWIDQVRLGRPLVDGSTTWTYLDAGNVDPAGSATDRTAWTRTDATLGDGWKDASGPFGVKGTGTDLDSGFPVTTKLRLYTDGSTAPDVPAYFFRTTFTLDADTLRSLPDLVGTLTYDDTATVYLNGERIAGWNDDKITSNLQYETPDGTAGGGDPVTSTFTVPAADLVAGTNTLAVEVHQCNSTSSDAYFGLDLAPSTAATGFTADQLAPTYASDTLPAAPDGADYYTWLLRSFTDAEQTPSIMGPNTVYPTGTTVDDLQALDDTKVVEINNAYTSKSDPQVVKALDDGAHSPYQTMADGLGSVLGPLYTQALADDELPKTKALLSYRVEKATSSSGDSYQTAKNSYQYKRPFVRMGFTSDGGLIKQWDSAGGYAGLAGDGSFPSGHTSHGYSQGITLATLLPQLAPQILARASEYGNNRIVLAFHYPTDIMGGRIVGEDTTTRRWSDAGYRTLLTAARTELQSVLAQKCREVGAGSTLTACIAGQQQYLPTSDALSVYHERLTYGFPQVAATDKAPSVPQGAENLLLSAFPDLTAAQRRTVLAATELPSGYVLDDESGAGSYQRLDLAAAMAAKVIVNHDGTLTVDGTRVGADGLPVTAPARTRLHATAQRTGYGEKASVLVTASATHGVVPRGTVTVREGRTTLGTARLGARGVATVALPRTLAVGSHHLSVRFMPADPGVTTEATTKATLRVTKGSVRITRVAVTAGHLRKGERATVTVRLAGPGPVHPTGRVTLTVDGRTVGSAPVRTRDGVSSATVRTDVLRRTGWLEVVYGGSASLRPTTLATDRYVRS